MAYVLYTVSEWYNSEGKRIIMNNYYEKTTTYHFVMNHMTTKDKARQFRTKAEAQRIGRNFLGRRFKIEKL